MSTGYFYLSLTPTATPLAYIYTHPFPITYSNNVDLAKQQAQFEEQFRVFNGNPEQYNAQWSKDYPAAKDADKDRNDEITALQNAGKIVLMPIWP